MQKLRPKSPDGANSPSFYSSPPITTFDHTQISLLPVPKFQPASGKPRPRAGVLKSLQTSAQKRVRGHVATATLLPFCTLGPASPCVPQPVCNPRPSSLSPVCVSSVLFFPRLPPTAPRYINDRLPWATCFLPSKLVTRPALFWPLTGAPVWRPFPPYSILIVGKLIYLLRVIYPRISVASPEPSLPTAHHHRPVLANERTQIRSDPVPGPSVDTLSGYRVGIAVTRSESDAARAGWDAGKTRPGWKLLKVGRNSGNCGRSGHSGDPK